MALGVLATTYLFSISWRSLLPIQWHTKCTEFQKERFCVCAVNLVIIFVISSSTDPWFKGNLCFNWAGQVFVFLNHGTRSWKKNKPKKSEVELPCLFSSLTSSQDLNSDNGLEGSVSICRRHLLWWLHITGFPFTKGLLPAQICALLAPTLTDISKLGKSLLDHGWLD